MKIIINGSNLCVGGGVQVALSFINELKYLKIKHEFHIFLSCALDNYIDQSKFPQSFSFYLIEKSPSSLKTRKKVVSQLNDIEKSIKPDLVFSIFGPSYWRPKATQLLGFADGWVFNPTSIAYDRLPFFQRIKRRLLTRYKIYYLKKDAEYYVVETNDAKIKLSRILAVSKNSFFVIGNTYSDIFNKVKYLQQDNKHYISLQKKTKNEFRLIYIAHNHANKNLQIINYLLPYLAKYNIKFVLTIDQTSFKNMFPIETNKIINLGPISQKSCPSVYSQCDALFAPTLLETFSAAYPEAMKMQLPILTSSYSFAQDICEDAAIYFDPLDPKDIAEKIITLSNNKSLKKLLVANGGSRLLKFETAKSRSEKYIFLCESLASYD